MSEIKNANDILILKKRKKNLDNEASDYEFGFDAVPQHKKIVSHKRQNVVLVPLPRNNNKLNFDSIHRLQRRRKFNRLNNKLQLKRAATNEKSTTKLSKQTEIVSLEEMQTKTNIQAAEEREKNLYSVEQNIIPGINPLVVSPHFVGSEHTMIDTTEPIAFELNVADDDDNTLIQNLRIEGDGSFLSEPIKTKEPILFSHKVVGKCGDLVKAMCVSCGFDENNVPKQICSAKENVSSNFITHLKVKYEITNFLFKL